MCRNRQDGADGHFSELLLQLRASYEEMNRNANSCFMSVVFQLTHRLQSILDRQAVLFNCRLCPPKLITVPSTFHPLPSLLNVIDFESESETDKTVHIRKRLHALASATTRDHR